MIVAALAPTLTLDEVLTDYVPLDDADNDDADNDDAEVMA